MFELPKAEWVVYSAGMRQIHKWSTEIVCKYIPYSSKIPEIIFDNSFAITSCCALISINSSPLFLIALARKFYFQHKLNRQIIGG